MSSFVNENNKSLLKKQVPQLDLALLQSYFDLMGREMLERMSVLYKQQATIYLLDIAKAQLTDSRDSWQEHCHKMKGAAASAGLKGVHYLLVSLEKTTAAQAEKGLLLAKLTQKNEQAIAAFDDWLARIN